jgi:hypothetical protein
MRLLRKKKQPNLRARLGARKVEMKNGAPGSPMKRMAPLFNKATQRPYLERFGIALPELHAGARPIDEIDFATLPQRVCIKPVDGWDSDGVMLFDGEVEIMTGARVPRGELKDFVARTMAAARFTASSRLMVEEFLEDYDSRYVIPRDFKVFAAGGRAWVIQVIDRNGPKSRICQSFYTPDWARVPDAFKTTLTENPAIPKPPLLDELVAAAETLSRDLRLFMRLDFYLTTRGVVFGEFTPTPADGHGFTPVAERLLCGLIERHPDTLAAGWTMQRAGRPSWLRRAADLVAGRVYQPAA